MVIKWYTKAVKYAYYISLAIVAITIALIYLYTKQVITADDAQFVTTDLTSFVQDFYKWALTISISLAVLMLVYAGYLFVTSAGNVDQVNKAKEYIIGALSGLVFLILASLIYQTLQTPVSGANNNKTNTTSNPTPNITTSYTPYDPLDYAV